MVCFVPMLYSFCHVYPTAIFFSNGLNWYFSLQSEGEGHIFPVPMLEDAMKCFHFLGMSWRSPETKRGTGQLERWPGLRSVRHQVDGARRHCLIFWSTDLVSLPHLEWYFTPLRKITLLASHTPFPPIFHLFLAGIPGGGGFSEYRPLPVGHHE
jgi:hypothetical protein